MNGLENQFLVFLLSGRLRQVLLYYNCCHYTSDEARAKAINLYRTLAGVQGVLGLGLLACGGCGTMYTNENSFGPPYYLGGFLVGSVVGICIIS